MSSSCLFVSKTYHIVFFDLTPMLSGLASELLQGRYAVPAPLYPQSLLAQRE